MDIDAAIEAARDARGRAYAPYSGFRSAAVVTDEGSIIPGALVENVSLGLAMCAAAAVDGPTEQHRLADLLPRGPHKS
ncbi:MAG: hypothetical protein ACERLM_02750 [Acidimicrobiales bacterium]